MSATWSMQFCFWRTHSEKAANLGVSKDTMALRHERDGTGTGPGQCETAVAVGE